MALTPYRFSKESNADFANTLKFRVNEYFRVNNISKHGGSAIAIKTAVMLAVFFIPFTLLLTGTFPNLIVFFLLWICMGIGTAGLGLNVMHDAIHGSYSKYPKVNKIMSLVLNIIGGHAEIWRLQHNVLHHSYTNIDGGDEDLFVTPVLRFSPNQQWKSIHRFQHIYAWFLYGLMTLSKLVFNDVVRAFRYKNMGLIKGKGSFLFILSDIAIWKVGYLFALVILPIILLPISWIYVVIGFLMMHFITGFLLSIVFQSAHIMPECEFPQADDKGNLDNHFVVHQMATTTNFAPKNKILFWLIGGLNFQVEHHLFPNICHIHYHRISKIVAATAREFDIRYNSQRSFWLAIWNHAQMLNKLGKLSAQ